MTLYVKTYMCHDISVSKESTLYDSKDNIVFRVQPFYLSMTS